MTAPLLDDRHLVQPATATGMTLQNPYCVRAVLDGQGVSRMVARQGTMVAFRGELDIKTKGQGIKKMLKRAATGEGVALMEIEGRGEVWLAEQARNLFIVPVRSGLSVAGHSVLCFDATVGYEIRRVKGAGMAGGGLFNCVFEGDGSVALASYGEPVVLPVTPDAPVRVDTDAVIGWSSGLGTAIHKSESLRSVLRGGSGEGFQLELSGEGSVIVQPSEGPPFPKKDDGGAIGDVLEGIFS